jgi:molybdate transport system substrate-binding protein
MASSRLVRFVLALLSVITVAACGGNSDDDVPLIFAAASLANVLAEAAKVYEQETDKRVEFSFGGSIALANQVARLGAPADGVFLVGEEPAQILESIIAPDTGSGFYLRNRLVVISGSDADPISSLRELFAGDTTIVIGDPLLSPAGQYARLALESEGIWEAVFPRLINTVDVRAAVAAVESGNADYGLVYATDAATSSRVSVAFELEDRYPAIAYFSRPVSDAQNSDSAQEFFDFLRTHDGARSLFSEAGFGTGVSTPLP